MELRDKEEQEREVIVNRMENNNQTNHKKISDYKNNIYAINDSY
jgi:hypothetical protein